MSVNPYGRPKKKPHNNPTRIIITTVIYNKTVILLNTEHNQQMYNLLEITLVLYNQKSINKKP